MTVTATQSELPLTLPIGSTTATPSSAENITVEDWRPSGFFFTPVTPPGQTDETSDGWADWAELAAAARSDWSRENPF